MKTLIQTVYSSEDGVYVVGCLDIPDTITQENLEHELELWREEFAWDDTQPDEFVTWLSNKHGWPEVLMDFRTITLEGV